MDTHQLAKNLIGQIERGQLDWVQARKDILFTHASATTEAARVACLNLHKSVLDAVERNPTVLLDGELGEFRNVRKQEYNLLLIKESMIGRTDGIVDPSILRAITEREVVAGRMTSDNDLYELALAGASILTDKPQRANSRSLSSLIRRWFR